MIGVFKPVNNPYGFDVREITITDGKVRVRNVRINDYIGVIGELPIFKCKKDCKKGEYNEQFIQNKLF